jgi:hypothetical protein
MSALSTVRPRGGKVRSDRPYAGPGPGMQRRRRQRDAVRRAGVAGRTSAAAATPLLSRRRYAAGRL